MLQPPDGAAQGFGDQRLAISGSRIDADMGESRGAGRRSPGCSVGRLQHRSLPALGVQELFFPAWRRSIGLVFRIVIARAGHALGRAPHHDSRKNTSTHAVRQLAFALTFWRSPLPARHFMHRRELALDGVEIVLKGGRSGRIITLKWLEKEINDHNRIAWRGRKWAFASPTTF